MSFSHFGRERRQDPRLNWDSLNWLFAFDLPEFPPHSLRIDPKDISIGGIKIYCNQPMPLQSRAYIMLIQPQTQKQLRLEGEIHRLEEIKQTNRETIYGIAIRWLKSEEVSALQTWIKPHLPYSSTFRSR